jgi:hypothetical protein
VNGLLTGARDDASERNFGALWKSELNRLRQSVSLGPLILKIKNILKNNHVKSQLISHLIWSAHYRAHFEKLINLARARK